jgi:hypothetical protein
MRATRPIRLIRKRESQANAGLSSEAPQAPTVNPEREIKNVVTRWVREHRQRSEEFRRTFASLWQAGEFQLPR